MNKLKLFKLFLAVLLFIGCDRSNKNNPLLQAWEGAYGGVPYFDKMDEKYIEQAMEVGMQAHLDEIDAIVTNPAAPSFENTIVALEASGKILDRVYPYYGIFSSNNATAAFRKIQQELAPKLSAYSSKIYQNEGLFKRIKAVYEATQKTPLNGEEQRITKLWYQQFEMSGANLNVEEKKRYAAINQELSKLYTNFSNNVLHDEESLTTFIDKNQLGGLSEAFIQTAAKKATEMGKDGLYAIINTRSSMDPFLTFSTERKLREKVWRNYYSRADNDDEYDNRICLKKSSKVLAEGIHLARQHSLKHMIHLRRGGKSLIF